MSTGGGCGFGELVNIDSPRVNPNETSGDSFGVSSSDCTNWTLQVELYNSASGTQPVPSARLADSPSACLDSISSDLNPGTDNAKPGDAFCVNSGDGYLAYVKISGVDATGDVTLMVDAWNTTGAAPASSSPAGAAYSSAYLSRTLTIQTMSTGGGCGFGELVNIDKGNADANETSGDSFGVSSSTCTNWTFTVELYNSASGTQPMPSAQLADSPSACLDVIASDPNPGTDNAKPGDAFCVNSGDGYLAYVKISSVDAQGEVALQVDRWSMPQ
jgi:hypothetical protein